MNDIGQQLRSLRKQKGMSQAKVARVLGMSRATYIGMEKGVRDLKVSEVVKLCSLFGVSVDSFIKNTNAHSYYNVVLNEKQSTCQMQVQSIRVDVPQQKLDAFKEVLLYILCKVGAKPNIGQTVLYKLLYFIDFDYYEKYEEQLIGAVYIKNRYGPTPVEFKKIVDKMSEDGEIERMRSKYYQHDQTKYIPLREPNLNELSAREIKHIDSVLDYLSDKNASELSDYSHKDIPWIVADEGQPLEYEAVFYRTDETSVRDYGEEQ